MGVMFIPFGEYQPGPPHFGYGQMSGVVNVVPATYGGYRPAKRLATFGTSAATAGTGHAAITAAFTHVGANVNLVGLQFFQFGYGHVYAGTGNDLFQWTLDGSSVTNVTKTAAGTYGTEAATNLRYQDAWSFLSWGVNVLATNFTSHVQRQVPAGGTARFADCITSPAKPKARFMSALGQHVVLANCLIETAGDAGTTGLATGRHEQLVWWSRTDDERSFSDPNSDPSWNSDFQKLIDTPGQITALARLGDDAIVIFKQHAMHLMSRTGDASLYSFQVLHEGHNIGVEAAHAGLSPAKSVVVVGRDIFYCTATGVPMVMEGLQRPRSLCSVEAVDALGLTSAAYDIYLPHSRTVAWVVGTNMVYYNLESQQFSKVTLETSINAVAYREYGFQSVANSSYPTFLSASGQQYTEDDDSQLAWTLTTKPMNLAPVEPSQLGIGFQSYAIRRVRPVYADSRTSLTTYPTITVYSADNLQMTGQDTTSLTSANLDAQNWYTIPGGTVTGEMFQFVVAMAAESTSGTGVQSIKGILGLEVDADAAGVR